MPTKEIYEIIKSTVGLDVASVGEDTIRRIVRLRMEEVKCNDVNAYLGILQNSNEERQNLINDITVPETWFFRDDKPFNLLSEYVSKTWNPAYFGQKLNILSVPCSTGEEPYSIAIALMESGLSHDDYVIDAVDVSTRVLEMARNGVYGQNSFRGRDESFRRKYFEQKRGQYKIIDSIKSSVSFYHENVLSAKFMCERGPYDVVFCRNLLIYFDMDTKRQVLKKLSDVMTHDGILFLGHAETGRMTTDLFESLRRPGTFAYKKLDESSKAKSIDFPSTVVSFATERKKTPIKKAPSSHPDKASNISRFSTSKADGSLLLDEIQVLADKGELDKAQQECVKYLTDKPDSAEGHYLLGLVKQAQNNNEEATASFKRSIYLDPNHFQALVHLAVLAEERGDSKAAANYRARSEKVKPDPDGM